MNDLSSLTTFFGWCTLINIAFLLFLTIMMTVFGDFAKTIHSKLFSLDHESLDATYFNFLANYKLLTIVVSFVPYLALKIMS